MPSIQCEAKYVTNKSKPKNPLATDDVLLTLPCGHLSSLARAFHDYTSPTGQLFSVVLLL